MAHPVIIRLKRTPIFYRIAIGSAIIIALSALVGTILTHFLTSNSATLWHFVIFTSVGVLVSLVLNLTIIKLSLKPLRDLRTTVNQIQIGQAEVEQLALEDTDPDIHKLTSALNSLITQLQNSNRQLHMLSERAISVQEEERKRIARSLHDDTGQSLSTLMIKLDRLEKQVPASDRETINQLMSIRQIAAESLVCLRGIIYDLRPAILDDLGLLPAIRWYSQTRLEEARISVQLDFPDRLPALSQSLTTTLFRVAQEGVNNIVRHSQARKATIALGIEQNEVYLRLQDDGQGFQTNSIMDGSYELHHWGLVGIQERIELVGGRMSILADPDCGTTLQVNAPIIAPGVSIDG